MGKSLLPDFIEHYFNQNISEECMLELKQLAKEYQAKKTDLETRFNNRNAGAYLYEKLTKESFKHTVQNELKQHDKDYKEKTKSIVKGHAEKDGFSFEEWKEPEPTKTLEQKSQETKKDLDNAQDRMSEKIEQFKQQGNESKLAESNQISRENQKEKDLEDLRKKWAQNRDMTRGR